MPETTLTPDEQSFFETGILPASLVTEPQIAVTEVTDDKPILEQTVVETPQPDQPDQSAIALEALRRSLADAEQQRATAEAQLRLMQEQKNAIPPEPAPDPETDPLGAMMHQLKTMNTSVLEMQSKLEAAKAQQEQQTQLMQFQSSVKALRDDFVKTTPDFQAAYDFLRAAKTADFKEIGATDQQIQQQLAQDEYTIAQNALKLGKNPVEVVYNMAKRHGYNPNPASTQQQATIEHKLETIKQGQASTKSLPATGNHQAETYTAEGLKNASNADLDKLVQDDAAWAKMTGGAVGKDIFS